MLQNLHHELFDKYSRKEVSSPLKELLLFCLLSNKLKCVKTLAKVGFSYVWQLNFIFSATSSVAQQGTYQFVQPY